MNTKRIFSVSLFLAMTVLIGLGGIWQPAAAKAQTVSMVAGETIGAGNQGLYISNIPVGVSDVFVDNVGRNLPSRFFYKMPMTFIRPALEVRFLTASGSGVNHIEALVYVYFNIKKTERKLWDKSGSDQLSIWFANEMTGKWEMCNTYLVHPSHGHDDYGRLACLAPGSGYYVLGRTDLSK